MRTGAVAACRLRFPNSRPTFPQTCTTRPFLRLLAVVSGLAAGTCETAAFETVEAMLGRTFAMDRLGHLAVCAKVRREHGTLTFALGLDQSHLPEVVRGRRVIVAAFPGGASGAAGAATPW
jgi:hypothetical protein